MGSKTSSIAEAGKAGPGWRLAFWSLSFSAFVGALVFVWLQTQQVRDGYRLVGLQTEYTKQLDLKRKLELNWAHLTAPRHLEEMARNRLRMAPADPHHVVFMQ